MFLFMNFLSASLSHYQHPEPTLHCCLGYASGMYKEGISSFNCVWLYAAIVVKVLPYLRMDFFGTRIAPLFLLLRFSALSQHSNLLEDPFTRRRAATRCTWSSLSRRPRRRSGRFQEFGIRFSWESHRGSYRIFV